MPVINTYSIPASSKAIICDFVDALYSIRDVTCFEQFGQLKLHGIGPRGGDITQSDSAKQQMELWVSNEK